MLDILNLTQAELEQWVQEYGLSRFRAAQLWQWLWAKGSRNFCEMTNLSGPLRQQLQDSVRIVWPEVETVRISQDTTAKLLLRLADGCCIETVLIPEKDHITQCLSTQAGCAMGCVFCQTGKNGLIRNLTMAEILGQILLARHWLTRQGKDPKKLRNMVFMGMGEPLLNLHELLRALSSMTSNSGLAIAPRRITVSTVGLPEALMRLAAHGIGNLALSLHAPTQELRQQLMPKAAQVPLETLMATLDALPLKPRQRVTCEYILLSNINDSPQHAKQLVRLLGQRRAKVNLIAYNRAPDSPFRAPAHKKILAFEKLLRQKGLTVTLRKSKGHDIAAACGQLCNTTSSQKREHHAETGF